MPEIDLMGDMSLWAVIGPVAITAGMLIAVAIVALFLLNKIRNKFVREIAGIITAFCLVVGFLYFFAEVAASW
ncbi:hypothetical protein [Planococcus lenghuensis]|uniref:Uncharacterized protein n=1 Tax=Planococcus lenghuensis TaxID=2213202 RepID=A0A1Q2L524_9BACL|nr:hypothetical protein [Planococcus lenghuensis]AQQ55555.1 hypothetical protein B0X71_20485 [Planococcus lenghuensis]